MKIALNSSPDLGPAVGGAGSFTSAPVARALLEAKKRGVKIKIVADQRNNTSEDRSGKSRAALSLLTEAGADVRLISAYRTVDSSDIKNMKGDFRSVLDTYAALDAATVSKRPSGCK